MPQLGMVGYSIRLSEFNQISTIRPNLDTAGFNVLRRIGYF